MGGAESTGVTTAAGVQDEVEEVEEAGEVDEAEEVEHTEALAEASVARAAKGEAGAEDATEGNVEEKVSEKEAPSLASSGIRSQSSTL